VVENIFVLPVAASKKVSNNAEQILKLLFKNFYIMTWNVILRNS